MSHSFFFCLFLSSFSISLCILQNNNFLKFCLKEESFLISKYFRYLKNDFSHCPSRKYLISLIENEEIEEKKNKKNKRNRKDSLPRVIIDIGANKGYNLPLFYSLYLPSLQINNFKWFQNAFKVSSHLFFENDLKGHCLDYNETYPRNKHSLSSLQANPQQLKLIAIDISSISLQLITNITKQFSKDLNTNLTVYTSNLAFSNREGIAHVGNCALSLFEGCRIGLTERYLISMTTIDRYLLTLPSLLNITTNKLIIDILMIDTEGYDSFVLQGANNTLYNHQIRVLIFEYHSLCPWSSTTLHYVIRSLYNYNYICYFEGFNRLWRLTGCWSSYYEMYTWSNVLCVYQYDKWYPILEKYRVTTKMVTKYKHLFENLTFTDKNKKICSKSS